MPYNLNSSSNNNILNKLEKFMLNNDLIQTIVSNAHQNMIKENEKEKKSYKLEVSNDNHLLKKSKSNIKVDNEWININNKDKKFWYFYMFINNLELCDLPPNHEVFKVETEQKIKFVEEIEKIENSTFKQYKISKKKIQSSISSIQNKITLEDLIGLSILYKRNLIYIYDGMYYELATGLTSNNNDWDIIYKDENGIEKVPNNNKKNELLKNIREENIYFKIDNIVKPIKSASSFTVDELIKIANKINILIEKEDGKKKLKKEIYDEILNKLNNFK